MFRNFFQKINLKTLCKKFKRKEIIKLIILRTFGNFFVILGIYAAFATFGPAIFQEARFRIDEIRGIKYIVTENTNGFSKIKIFPNERILTAPDPFFSVIIPKIGAQAKIIPNVSPNDENQYVSALKQGIAHAKGSVFPGMNGTVFLFAHSTDTFWDTGRYNAVFYLLKDLKKGDKIIVFFKGQRYNYVVFDSRIVDPNEVNYLNNAQKTEPLLIMQTCWPPGTTWKRLLVFAKPV